MTIHCAMDGHWMVIGWLMEVHRRYIRWLMDVRAEITVCWAYSGETDGREAAPTGISKE